VTEPRTSVLLIEDEEPMRRMLGAALDPGLFELREAATAQAGLAAAAAHEPDLILLDLGLPDGDGIEVTRRLREWTRRPVIVLSARGQEADKVAALDAGADDYLTKPFSVGELLARMRVALRHAARVATDPPPSVFGDVRLDRASRRVTVRGSEVHLTPTEYRLFGLLAEHAGKVLTHRQLLRDALGPGRSDEVHSLRVYMAQLRAKLEPDPARPRLLRTEPGVGYRLMSE
jgi:two-component system KDP operon response regulator KdpE